LYVDNPVEIRPPLELFEDEVMGDVTEERYEYEM